MAEEFTETEIRNSIGLSEIDLENNLHEAKCYFRKWKETQKSKKFDIKIRS